MRSYRPSTGTRPCAPGYPDHGRGAGNQGRETDIVGGAWPGGCQFQHCGAVGGGAEAARRRIMGIDRGGSSGESGATLEPPALIIDAIPDEQERV
jgi:hypothetical protein